MNMSMNEYDHEDEHYMTMTMNRELDMTMNRELDMTMNMNITNSNGNGKHERVRGMSYEHQ
jgi:hypothetical protein